MDEEALKSYLQETNSVFGDNILNDGFQALTCQSMIPAFYLCAVVSFAIGQLNLFHHPILEYTVFISFIFIPVFSPLASLYFVGPYR